MQKWMDRISMVVGYGVVIIALFFKLIGGTGQRYSVIEVWVRSLLSGHFLHFWQTAFPAGVGLLVGSGFFLVLVLLYGLDALLITCHRYVSFVQSAKAAWLYFTMFFYFIFIQFYASSMWLVLFLILCALEFLLNRYLEDKVERDRKYAEAQKVEKAYLKERKRRLAFPGSYPPVVHQIIRKNIRFYYKDYLLLVLSNALVFFVVRLLFFTYHEFSSGHSMETLFDRTGLLRIMIESGGVLLLLLFLFLSFMDGLFIDFKAKHMELLIQLGIRKKTFLLLLLEEFGLCGLLGIGLGSIVSLLITRGGEGFGWAVLLSTGLWIVAMAVHQEKILRLIQFQPRERRGPDQPSGRWLPVFLTLGLLFLAVTFWWFHRRKSAETLLVIGPLTVALFLLFYSAGGAYVKRKYKKRVFLLSRNDLFYRFRKSLHVFVLTTLLQLLIVGFFLPRLITFQLTTVDSLFPYDVVAKVKQPEVKKVERALKQEHAQWTTYPYVPVTSVDGDPEWEFFGTSRPVMFIQGQHIGISEATYQQLRQMNHLGKNPLGLKKGQWHVVYQQAISIRGQPIDWDPQSARPRLRIGTPLESYNTANVDQIFPMRQIKSQERLLLTGMFQRGLQENILVFADEEFAEFAKMETPRQLFLITGDQAVGTSLHFLNQQYAEDKRWDASIEPVYEKVQRKRNVVTENQLHVLLLLFTVFVCLFISVGILAAKFESDHDDLLARRRLLDQLGMRQKEQRKLIKEQVGLFLLVPILVGLVISLGFIWIMGTLRFFAVDEWQQFTRLFLIDYSLYLFCWALTAVFLYRRIEKWR